MTLGISLIARLCNYRGIAKKQDGVERRVIVETAQVADLERLIHEKTRLAILTALAANDCLTFSELKSIVKANDGNVSVHTRKLELAKYVESRKSFEGRVPRTEYKLTAAGRRAFDRYLKHMEALIKSSRG